jgi:hypothetical protein
MKYHPDGVAALVASIVAPTELEILLERRCQGGQKPLSSDEIEDLRAQLLDKWRNRVEELAREHYKVSPCDFDNSSEWQSEYPRNGKQNLAKLNRANLR